MGLEEVDQFPQALFIVEDSIGIGADSIHELNCECVSVRSLQHKCVTGYRKIRVLLNREGRDVGKYLVYRLREEEGLMLKRTKQPGKRKAGARVIIAEAAQACAEETPSTRSFYPTEWLGVIRKTYHPINEKY